MWLYKHHTCSDIIDLDHESGRWRPVDKSEYPKGARVLVDLPVKGSYTEESGKKFFCYWTDDRKFIFRSFDGKVIEICQKDEDGRTELLTPGLRCDISQSKHADGRINQGFSDVRLVNAQGISLYELTYKSEYYVNLYNSDFTAAAAIQSLASWDFFVALKMGIEHFTERALSGRIELSFNEHREAVIEGRKVARDDLIYGDTDEPAPRAGVWAAVSDLRATTFVNEGEMLPPLNGVDVSWVWSRNR